MSRFIVDLDESEKSKSVKHEVLNVPTFGNYQEPKRHSMLRKVLSVFAILVVITFFAGSIASFFYWQSVKKTPAYSLALIVDAARRDDKEQMDKLIDAEAVVNNFLPQITDKAVELYGRNLAPEKLKKVAQAAAPLIPAIKDRAREELPHLIVEKTKPIEKVPYWMIALGAKRGVDIKIEADTATVKSKIPDKPLELTMEREGNLWKVTGVKDEVLAKKIAEKIGQELIAMTGAAKVEDAGRQIGVDNLGEVLKKVNDIFK